MPQLKDFISELALFSLPIFEASQSTDHLKIFFLNFGYNFSTTDLEIINTKIGDIISNLENLFENKEDINLSEFFTENIEAIGKDNEIKNILNKSNNFSRELFNYLSIVYLDSRVPIILSIIKTLGIIETKIISESDISNGRDIDFPSVNFNWSRLGDFIRSPNNWAKKVYHWEEEDPIFDYNLALMNLIYFVDSTQLALTQWLPLPDNDIGNYISNAPTDEGFHKIVLPFIQSEFAEMDNNETPSFNTEVGLNIVPTGDFNNVKNLGLAVTPYFKGEIKKPFNLNDDLTITVSFGTESDNLPYVSLQPNGVNTDSNASISGDFEIALKYSHPNDQQDKKVPIYLVGEEGETHIKTNAILASIGGNATASTNTVSKADLFIAGGFDDLSISIDVSEDGLLSTLIPKPIEVEAGQLIMGWRAEKGVYFEGGSRLEVKIPLYLELGPVNVYELNVALDWLDSAEISATITGDLTLGPIYAYVEETGVSITARETPKGNGLLGQYDLDFGFIPPSGYALSLNAAPIEGGGFLSIKEHEYRGALALKFKDFGFSAFAILTTQLPSQDEGGEPKDGFSLAASIFGEFSLPLGYGFFLTGLGGVIGINRTIDTDALREVLYAGRLDNIIFPKNPIENAKTILEDMAAILPSMEGQHLVGPVARISWGVPKIIDIKLGVIIEVGNKVRVLVLGGLSCNLPSPEAAIIVLQFSFFGEIDFASERISFDGTLEGSRILSFPVAGDVAIRTGWAARLNHIAAFGGLHPRYPRPANLPDLKRLSISFGTNNPKITLSAYQAATLSSLQFGARADLYAKGPKIFLVGQVSAEGYIYFNTLIYFNPFNFNVELGGAISLLVDGDIKCGLHFQLALQGPNTYKIDGKVWVTVLGQDINFKIQHTWGNRQTLPVATTNAVTALREALESSGNLEPIATISKKVGVSFRKTSDDDQAFDVIGGLRFVQRRLPLGIDLKKIGEAQILGHSNLDIRVSDSKGKEVATTDVMLEFVRGHFFNLSESDRLKVPAFDQYKAGFEFSPDGWVVNNDDAVSADYDYEIIKISPPNDNLQLPDLSITSFEKNTLKSDFLSRFGTVTADVNLLPHELIKTKEVFNDQLLVRDPLFITQEQALEKITVISDDATKLSYKDIAMLLEKTSNLQKNFSQASNSLNSFKYVDVNPVTADYVVAAQLRR